MGKNHEMFKQRNKNGSNKRTKGKLEQWNAIFFPSKLAKSKGN